MMPSSANTLKMNTLTEREREVMKLVVLGNTSKEIAKQLAISHRTVDVHRGRVMQKTGATSLSELIEMVFSDRDDLAYQLNKSEARFIHFLNALPAIAFIKDKNGNIIFGNHYMEETLGITGWKDKPVETLFSEKVSRKMSLDDLRAMQSGRLVLEEEVPNAMGENRLFQTYKFRIPMKDGADMLGGFALDITEKRQAEIALEWSKQHLAEAQEIAHLGSWSWNIATGENAWSDELYRIFGYEPDTIKPTYDLFIQTLIPDDREKVKMAIAGAIEKDHPYNIYYRIALPDGTLKSIHAKGIVERSRSGKPVRMIGTAHDITERMLAKNIPR